MIVNKLEQLDLDKLYAYSDYMLWRFDERVELLKGKISKMSPAPNVLHQKVSAIIFREISWFLKKTQCQIFSAPFDVRLPVSEEIIISKKYKNKAKSLADGKMMTVVQPDICVICDEDKLDEKGCVGAPDLIIEKLSPGNTRTEMKDKFEIYQEAGVKEYWLVSPHNEFVLIYTLQKGKYLGSKPYTIDDILKSSVIEGFELEVNEIFSKKRFE